MHFFLKALTLLLLGSFATANGQNLVPNPSFEDTIPCASWPSIPPGPITDWFTPNNSTPDWFGAGTICSDQTPSNIAGFQIPRTGIAYAGFFSLDDLILNTREYLSCSLIQPLQQNKKYCGGFFVSWADRQKYAIDALGALFSLDTPSCSGSYCLLQYTPQVTNPIGNVLSDSINWVLISGSFNASGGEQFMTIGDFIADSLNTIDSIPIWTYPHAYYYIDDVFVEEMQVDTANAGADITICEGDSIQLGVAVCNGCIYTWEPAGGLSDSTIAQPLAFPTQTTTYILTVTDTSTGTICEWTSTDTVTVTVIPFTPQTANAGADMTLCKGESVTLGTAACGSCTYQWQPFSNLDNVTIAQPVATPAQTTMYILTMTDSVPPCSRTTSDNVTVFIEDCSIEIYNIFTPNADTKNDFFFIKNLPPNSSLQIFNRWGGRVYESSNYNNKWDGEDVPDGTYYYILVLPDKESYNGFVEIRR